MTARWLTRVYPTLLLLLLPLLEAHFDQVSVVTARAVIIIGPHNFLPGRVKSGGGSTAACDSVRRLYELLPLDSLVDRCDSN